MDDQPQPTLAPEIARQIEAVSAVVSRRRRIDAASIFTLKTLLNFCTVVLASHFGPWFFVLYIFNVFFQMMATGKPYAPGLRGIVLGLAIATKMKAYLHHAPLVPFTPGQFLGVFIAFELISLLELYLDSPTRPTPERIALYIDEQNPELMNRMSTAVQYGAGAGGASEELVRRIVEESRTLVVGLPIPRALRGKDMPTALSLGVVCLILFAALAFWQRPLWLPSAAATTATPPRIAAFGSAALEFKVDPGDARVRVGSDQSMLVTSILTGHEVAVKWRAAGKGDWRTEAMPQGSAPTVHHYTFNAVHEDIEYQVAFGPAQSKVFRLTAWTPAATDSINLTYHYPDYLKWPDRDFPNAGAISAIEGTRVALDVKVNQKIAKAEIVVDGDQRLPMKSTGETAWTGTIEVKKDGRYRIELTGLDGQPSEYNPEYPIAVQPDRPPQVALEFPRRDGEVTRIDEIPFSFKVTDDFGIEEYGLQVEVVGKEKKRLPLKAAPAEVRMADNGGGVIEASAGHVMPLEDLSVEPGDLISWAVWARDRKPGRAEAEELSDVYFLEVRPFARTYEEAVTHQQGGAQKGGQKEAGDQKELILATWNLRRRALFLDPADFTSQRATIIESQKNLLNKTRTGPLGTGGSTKGHDMIAAMQAAVEALEAAALPEPGGKLGDAITQMQKAYQLIVSMKPDHAQVQQMQSKPGDGGGEPENTADVAQLEMEKNRNFYEEEKRARKTQEQAAEDLSKIKELAQRQQVLNEEMARLVSEIEKAKDKAERERLERELQKLREEQRRALERLDQSRAESARRGNEEKPNSEAQRNMEKAREEMNRTLEKMDSGELQQARTSGARTLDALKDLQQKLESLGGAAAAERMNELAQRFDKMREREKQLGGEIEKLKDAHSGGKIEPGLDPAKKRAEVAAAKDELGKDFEKFMNDAGDLAEKSAHSQELMSQKLGDWLRKTAREGIHEDMQKSEPLVRHGVWDEAAAEESKIGEKLGEAGKGLHEVAASAAQDDVEAMKKALNRLDSILNEQASAKEGEKGDGKKPGEAKNGKTAGREIAKADDNDAKGAKGGTGDKPSDGKPEDQSAQPGKGTQGKPGNPGDEKGDGKEPGDQKSARQKPGQGEKPGAGRTGDSKTGSSPGQPGDLPQDGQLPENHPDAASAEPDDKIDLDPKPGEQKTRTEMPGGAQNDQPSRTGARPGAARGGRSTFRDGNTLPAPDAGQEFARSGFDDWSRNLREAEALLPRDSDMRRQIERIRNRAEQMRAEFKRHGNPPRYELFLNDLLRPLAETADRLDHEIGRALSEEEFLITDEGSVPAQYKKHVADYFESLARSGAGSR